MEWVEKEDGHLRVCLEMASKVEEGEEDDFMSYWMMMMVVDDGGG